MAILSILTNLTILFNTTAPANLYTEWFQFSSHLEFPREYSIENPTILRLPINTFSCVFQDTAWITLRSSDHIASSMIKFDKPYKKHNYIYLEFGWFGAEWSLGITFGDLNPPHCSK